MSTFYLTDVGIEAMISAAMTWLYDRQHWPRGEIATAKTCTAMVEDMLDAARERQQQQQSQQ